MLSSLLPIPANNTLIPLRSNSSRCRPAGVESHPFSPLHSRKLHGPVGTATNLVKVALREQVREEEEGRGGNSIDDDSPDGEPLPEGIREDMMPNHVAVIMDGNARWARLRRLPTSAGHEAGSRSLRELVELCSHWGIRVLTVFAFSYDNWIRPKVRLPVFSWRYYEQLS